MNKKLALTLIFASLFLSCTKIEKKTVKEEMMVEKVMESEPEVNMKESSENEIKMDTEEMESEEKGSEGVLAIVDGEKITQDDLEIEIKAMPEQYKYYFETDEGKDQLLKQMVQQKLIIKEAKKMGLDKNEDYLRNVKAYEERLLSSLYITEEIFDNVEVSDEDVLALYEENKEMYKQEEQVSAAHILIQTNGLEAGELEAARIKAIEILNRALEGDDFTELAINFSEGPSGPNGGNLGWFKKGEMVAPFEMAAFEGVEGEIYPEIVETQFGYHIIKVNEKKEESYIPLEEVAAQLEEELINKKRYDSYNDLVKDLEEEYKVEMVHEEVTEEEIKEETKEEGTSENIEEM